MHFALILVTHALLQASAMGQLPAARDSADSK